MFKLYKEYLEAEDKEKYLSDLKEKDELMGYKVLMNNNCHQEPRKKEFPSFEEQLDIIFHHGIDEWKNQINKIKEKYPKVKGDE